MVTLRAVSNQGMLADYDDGADVLYLTYGKPRAGYGDTGADDITLRYSDDGVPIGATVIGYHASKWSERKKEMAIAVGRHIGVDADEVLRSLREIGL